MSSVEAHMVLLDHYETYFQIFDHGDPIQRQQHPFGLVAMHDSEENGPSSLLFEMIEKYHTAEIATQFGLSVVEFLKLPREIVSHLFELADRRLRAASGQAEDLDAKLKKAADPRG